MEKNFKIPDGVTDLDAVLETIRGHKARNADVFEVKKTYKRRNAVAQKTTDPVDTDLVGTAVDLMENDEVATTGSDGDIIRKILDEASRGFYIAYDRATPGYFPYVYTQEPELEFEDHGYRYVGVGEYDAEGIRFDDVEPFDLVMSPHFGCPLSVKVNMPLKDFLEHNGLAISISRKGYSKSASLPTITIISKPDNEEQ